MAVKPDVARGLFFSLPHLGRESTWAKKFQPFYGLTSKTTAPTAPTAEQKNRQRGGREKPAIWPLMAFFQREEVGRSKKNRSCASSVVQWV